MTRGHAPRQVGGEMGTYLEFRVPSASSVGYITIAGLVAAGLDGVKRKMPLPPPVTSHGP